MNANRYDIYTGFHKLLRSRLFEASLRLGRADFGAADLPVTAASFGRAADHEGHHARDAEGALAFLRETLELLAEHAAKEDAHVRRPLEAYAPLLSEELDRAHAHLEDAMMHIDRLAIEVASMRKGPESARGGGELYARFNVLVADQVRHMAQEERDANAALWAHLSDRELAEIHQTIVQRDPQERQAWLLERLLPVWNVPDRAAMWRQVRRNAPPAAAAAVREIGSRVLGSDEWARVERAAEV